MDYPDRPKRLWEERQEAARLQERKLQRAKLAWQQSDELKAAYPSLASWLRTLRAAMASEIPAGEFTTRFL